MIPFEIERAIAETRTLRVVDYFQSLSPDSVAGLGSVYAPDALFKDPFNEVRGVAAIARVFAHMFETLHAPRFVVTDVVTDGSRAFLTWDFHFARRAGASPMTIHGATRLEYGPDGRIARHRDYWDPADELFAKLPLIGAAVRWVQRRLAAPA